MLTIDTHRMLFAHLLTAIANQYAPDQVAEELWKGKFFAWGSKPVFYNKATGGVPGLKAGVVESLTAHQTHMHDQQLVQALQVKVWRHIRNRTILVDNPNIAQDWYFFWMVTWQQGWHSRARRGRSTGCRRWRRRWGAASSPEEEEETATFPWKATYQSW